MEIDISPLLDVGIELLAGILLALGSFAVWKVSTWLKLKEDDAVRGYLNEALARAVEYGKVEAKKAGARTTVKIENVTVAAATQYAVERVPDALARFKITPEALTSMIRARLPQ